MFLLEALKIWRLKSGLWPKGGGLGTLWKVPMQPWG